MTALQWEQLWDEELATEACTWETCWVAASAETRALVLVSVWAAYLYKSEHSSAAAMEMSWGKQTVIAWVGLAQTKAQPLDETWGKRWAPHLVVALGCLSHTSACLRALGSDLEWDCSMAAVWAA